METTTPDTQPDYPIQPVPFTAVRCADHFWAPRIATNRTVTIPFAFQQCETTGRIANFRRAAAVLRGDPDPDRTLPGYAFDDSDVYKVIEGAAYTLRSDPDPALESYVDELVADIASAQEPDGYLYPARTIDPAHPHRVAGPERWVLERAHSHELYNLGHLYEAAVPYAQATGKRELLDIALRTADLLTRTFGPNQAAIWPGHPITEMALVRLYRATGDERYLDLAQFLLDKRGPDGAEGSGNEYNQSHRPLVEQDQAVGHAVRAMYLYAGLADVAALRDLPQYRRTLDRLWADVVGTKLYITGGIGATATGEAFGAPYDLPNLTAYSETCAAIALVFWSHRLFLLYGDAQYIDVMERALYNGLLAGVALDGQAFFYDNPLESDGSHQRSPWFGCACCPSNIARFLPALPGYIYARQDDTIYTNLFVTGNAEIPLDDGRVVRLAQETDYPWTGRVRLHVEDTPSTEFTLALRIPGWARGEVVPGDLYRFADSSDAAPALRVNGDLIQIALDRGFARLTRIWQAGDVVELDLPMPVRRVVAHPQVAADQGRVALQRGPLVYCVEQADNLQVSVRELHLPDAAPLHAEFVPDLLEGVTVIRGAARDDSGTVDFTAIPYYAWANRGPGAMTVWLVGGRQTTDGRRFPPA